MPITPFHVVVVWPLYVRWPRRWDLLALTWGAMMPDLEIVTLYPLLQGIPNRGIMHSIMGVVTVNLVLTLLTARTLIPRIAIRLENRFPHRGWRRFAGWDFVADQKRLPVAAFSGIVGGLTHLVLDLPGHGDTPLLWPWRNVSFSLGPWASEPLANLVVSAILGVVFLRMMAKWVGRSNTPVT